MGVVWTSSEMRFTGTLVALLLLNPQIAFTQPADIEVLTQYKGEPASFRVVRRIEVNAGDFFAEYAQVFGLSDADAMQVRSESISTIDGLKTIHLAQTHRGLPVIGAEYVLTENEHGVTAGLGSLVPNLNIDPDSAQVSLQQAQQIARQHTIDQLNLGLTNSGQIQGTPGCELSVVPRTHKRQHAYFRLGWRCHVERSPPYGTAVVHVDAKYGTSLYFDSGARDAWANTPASGTNLYNQTVTFIAQHENGTWRLQSGGVPNMPVSFPVTTKNAHLNQDSPPVTDYENSSPNFVDPNFRDGVTAHWGTQKFLEYLNTEFGRNSWDDTGGPVTIFVDWYPNVNATYLGSGFFGFGRDLQGLVTPDSIGHEFGHAINIPPGKLDHHGESGALAEGFADAFGILAEHTLLGTTDWVLGADLSTAIFRSVKEPWQDPHPGPSPRAYLGTDWIDLNQGPTPAHIAACASPDRHCHVNGGVFRRWFYLLTVGENGWVDNDITNQAYSLDGLGIGIQKAGQIVYRTLTGEVTSATDFSTIRERVRLAADRLYGGFSTPVAISELAWGAVGVGSASFTKPVTTPTTGTANVFPWPVYLSWESGVHDNYSWQIQIATNDQFLPQDIVVDKMVNTSLDGFGDTTVDLESDTQYFWRVRSTATDQKEWWYEPAEFETADMTPTGNDPTDILQSNHPWRLPFRFTADPIVKHFDIEVFGPDVEVCAEQFAVFDEPTSFKSVFVDDEEPDKDIEITVPKDSVLAWRVRAKSDAEGTHKSEWSECYVFKTSDPKPVLKQPANNDFKKPWPVYFQWEKEDVRGAFFEIVVEGKSPFAPGHKIRRGPLGSNPFFFPDIFKHSWSMSSRTAEDNFGHTVESSLDLPGSWKVDEVEYEWKIVNVKGPPWGTDEDPETESENGLDSDTAQFRINGDDTAVRTVWPSDYDSQAPVWEGSHGDITYTWQSPEAGADEYALQVWSVHSQQVDPNAPPLSKGEMLGFGNLISADSNLQFPIALGEKGPFSGWDTHTGFLWQIIAFKGSRERGQVGVVLESDYYPNTGPPDALLPIGLQNTFGPGTMEFQFYTPFAPGGRYDIDVWDSPNCSGNAVHQVHSFGSSFIRASDPAKMFVHGDWGTDKTWSWKLAVKGWPNYKYSECTEFKTGKPPVPDAPDVVPGFFGSLGQIIAVFSQEEHAETYQMEISQNDKSNVITQFGDPMFTWNKAQLQNHLVGIDNDLCNDHGNCAMGLQQQDTSWFVVVGQTQALNHYFYRVKACNSSDDCSLPSEYSEWHETLAWPWW